MPQTAAMSILIFLNFEEVILSLIPLQREQYFDMLPTTSYMRDPRSVSTPRSMGENKRDICIDYLGGVCRHGMSCTKYHSRESYQWQKEDPTQNGWLDMTVEENRKIEQSYCNPVEEHCDVTDKFNRSV